MKRYFSLLLWLLPALAYEHLYNNPTNSILLGIFCLMVANYLERNNE